MTSRAAIVILGQSLNADGTPPQSLVNRVKEATRIYESDRDAFLVVPTGGDPARTGTSEAESMRHLLLASGVREADILLEDKSQNTIQNAWYVLDLLLPIGIHKIILVTSDFHMPRAYLLFRAVLSHRRADLEITESPSESGCPPETEKRDHYEDVNQKPLSARLADEQRYISTRIPDFCATFMPGISITVPPVEEIDHALKKIESILPKI